MVLENWKNIQFWKLNIIYEFSNADSSVVRRRPSSSSVVNFSLKIFISQKMFDNVFSLAWSFIRKVPMYCIHVDLVESS